VPPGLDTGSGITSTRAESEEYLLSAKFPTLDVEAPRPPPHEMIVAGEECHEEMERCKVTSEEIGESLRYRNNKSSPGSDGIRWKHLKILHKKRPKLLTDLMSACLRYGVFPTEWKEAFVSFIPKGDKPPNEAGSYRPISLLSYLGKLLEAIIKNRLQDRVDDAQYGFRRGMGTEDCMHDMLEKLSAMRAEHAYVSAISLDISRAFDHV